jgi:hypothetical protein
MMPTPPAPRWPSDHVLRAQNKVLLADRLRWPEGALQACQELERRHPGWHVSWLGERIDGRRPAGFHASLEGWHKVHLYAATVDRLEPEMDVPEHDYGLKGCSWCVLHPDGRTVRL